MAKQISRILQIENEPMLAALVNRFFSAKKVLTDWADSYESGLMALKGEGKYQGKGLMTYDALLISIPLNGKDFLRGYDGIRLAKHALEMNYPKERPMILSISKMDQLPYAKYEAKDLVNVFLTRKPLNMQPVWKILSS